MTMKGAEGWWYCLSIMGCHTDPSSHPPQRPPPLQTPDGRKEDWTHFSIVCTIFSVQIDRCTRNDLNSIAQCTLLEASSTVEISHYQANIFTWAMLQKFEAGDISFEIFCGIVQEKVGFIVFQNFFAWSTSLEQCVCTLHTNTSITLLSIHNFFGRVVGDALIIFKPLAPLLSLYSVRKVMSSK